MVLLDIVAKKYSSDDIIVAHFNHNIRDDSGKDAEFVARVSEEIYHIRYIIEKGNLGTGASEEKAREARYKFLRKIATENDGAKIYTAHHLDDLIETVAINFIRGTGWRGLAGLDASDIRRPLLETDFLYEPIDKTAIMEYAAKRGLRWREDTTNSSDRYLRNRVREKLTETGLTFDEKMKIWEVWQRQKVLRRKIDEIVQEILPGDKEEWQRKWFRDLDESSALELLRAGSMRRGVSATRPQLEDFRRAILNYAPGKYFNLPQDELIKLNKEDFIF